MPNVSFACLLLRCMTVWQGNVLIPSKRVLPLPVFSLEVPLQVSNTFPFATCSQRALLARFVITDLRITSSRNNKTKHMLIFVGPLVCSVSCQSPALVVARSKDASFRQGVWIVQSLTVLILPKPRFQPQLFRGSTLLFFILCQPGVWNL